jgi:hypothetical protein
MAPNWSAVAEEVELDEMRVPNAVQLPSAQSTQNELVKTGTNDWVISLSLPFGLLGVGLGAIALQRGR